jgi:hypothetical protein
VNESFSKSAMNLASIFQVAVAFQRLAFPLAGRIARSNLNPST